MRIIHRTLADVSGVLRGRPRPRFSSRAAFFSAITVILLRKYRASAPASRPANSVPTFDHEHPRDTARPYNALLALDSIPGLLRSEHHTLEPAALALTVHDLHELPHAHSVATTRLPRQLVRDRLNKHLPVTRPNFYKAEAETTTTRHVRSCCNCQPTSSARPSVNTVTVDTRR